jgi:hypothetical protein
MRTFLPRRGGCGRPRSSAPAGTLGGSARRGPRRRGAVGGGPRARGLTKLTNGGQKRLCFRLLWFPGAPGARRPWAGPRAAALGIGWRRGHRRRGGRLGLAAALRAGGGSVLGSRFSVLGGGFGGGFAERAGTAGPRPRSARRSTRPFPATPPSRRSRPSEHLQAVVPSAYHGRHQFRSDRKPMRPMRWTAAKRHWSPASASLSVRSQVSSALAADSWWCRASSSPPQ